jgi:hypothetical protein
MFTAERNPRWGAFVLSLPVLSMLAMILQWQQTSDLLATSRFARETLTLVPLGLPFFIPLAFADRLGISFWSAFAIGLVVASVSVGGWLWFAQSK